MSVYLPSAVLTLATGRLSDWSGIDVGAQLLSAAMMLIATVVGITLVVCRERIPPVS
ncbi:hypothetical protein [Streptomyces flavofungini]|uniref:hypothetical protein n=1 Tax=Streptomyces flavofungini TaxID=68200 RepID=UPI0034DFB2B1